VNETTLRLALVPPALRDRAAATARAIVGTALPLGSVIGGSLAEHIGFGATTILGAVVTARAVFA
jgi:predicted MFS family arabinose efflux permease